MNSLEIKSVLITGANAGLGKEVARQMALRDGVERIYLACRNEAKARAAKQELEQQTGKHVFKIVLMDVSDVSNVKSALNGLQEPIDALVMNAGGSGGKTPLHLTRDGVTEIFAANVLGHVALFEGLVASGRLKKTAVYLGSEAARGVPKMRMKRPALPTSSPEDFADVITGRDFAGKSFDGALAYAEVKYVAALWMAYQASVHPNLRIITMSPGNTQGTEIANGMPTAVRLLMKYVMMPIVAPLMGMAHSLQTGASRIVAGLTDSTLKSGVFYGSGAQTLTGPVMNQSEIFPDLAHPAFQQNADQAIHRFV
jgi:NAD(P)-dependent dehydrogenase (short-subunit alcohol dehydrogenase family)